MAHIFLDVLFAIDCKWHSRFLVEISYSEFIYGMDIIGLMFEMVGVTAATLCGC